MTCRVVSNGGGRNSAALLCLAYETGQLPDSIVFSDTGSEMPHTYLFLDVLDTWLAQHAMVPVTRIRWIRKVGERKGTFLPLHLWCEEHTTVPSRAFGLSGCTTKWKQQPIEEHVARLPSVMAAREAGQIVERWLGYDAGEMRRVLRMNEVHEAMSLYHYRAPLFDAGLDREDCLQVLARHGLPDPGKSSCWMCPSMRKQDIDELGRRYPDLLARALRMEANADLTSRKGLGERLNWGDYVKTREGREPDEKPCGCSDGDEEP